MGKKLLIGAYHLQKNARSEAHIKDIADCGIEYIIGMNRDYDALDLFEKYGVGAIVEGAVPGWWGGHGENAGKLAEINPLEKYEEKAADFKDHPAIVGLCSGDEPSALDFPYYGKVIEKIKELFPGKIPYLNLYANYGVLADCTVPLEKQFGTRGYEEHLEEYAKNIPLDYISFDHYPYSANAEGYIENLRQVSEVCRRTGREMWVVAQVNSSKPGEWISENQLRFQGFSALAFGAARITWACYCAGWWHNQVLDNSGEKTKQYEKLKKVNGELKQMASRYADYDFVKGYAASANETAFAGKIKITAPCPTVIGEMKKDGGSGALICAVDDPYDTSSKENKITFRTDADDVVIFGESGIIPYIKRTDGTYEFALLSSHAALVLAE